MLLDKLYNPIKDIYKIQQQLDVAAGFPDGDLDRAIELTLLALNSEVHEVMKELKPVWCWWQDKQVNRELLKEELIDCWFFYLSLLDKVDRSVPDFDIDSWLGMLNAEMLPHLRETLKDNLEPYRNIYTQMNMMQINVALDNFGLEQLALVSGALLSSSVLAGLYFPEIFTRYKRKARVNLERWNQTELPLYAQLA